ncbi:MAG: tetraacyldisaccharide 4'-kinase, partial [Isosphaeraceae bacterium]|nr:tetraacyldisaccharide 4'-kinase [Isosphaeraceae bacterium]
VRAEQQAGALCWAEARHAPLDVIDAIGGSGPLSQLRGKAVAAFCGIGNPEGFRLTLEGLGVGLKGFRAFPDHHPYTAADVAELAGWVRGLGVELALTTQKDLVKLRADALAQAALRAVRIGLEIIEGSELLEARLARLLPSGR